MNTTLALRFRAHDIRMLGASTLGSFVVLWSALIFWLSAQQARSDDTGGSAVHLLLMNAGHAPLFGIWAAGAAFYLACKTPRPIPDISFTLNAIVATLAFGTLDEIHQYFVPGRTASWTDVATDGIGAAVALYCLRYVASPRSAASGLLLRILIGIVTMLASGAVATWVDTAGASST